VQSVVALVSRDLGSRSFGIDVPLTRLVTASMPALISLTPSGQEIKLGVLMSEHSKQTVEASRAQTHSNPPAAGEAPSSSKRAILRAAWIPPVIVALNLPRSGYAANVSGTSKQYKKDMQEKNDDNPGQSKKPG